MMLTQYGKEPMAHGVMDESEVSESVPRAEQLNDDARVHGADGPSDDEREASSRMLMRFLPLAYGAGFGGVSDHLLWGTLAGLALSLVVDMSMADNSLLRGAWRSIFRNNLAAVLR